jgi:hypothetical protein
MTMLFNEENLQRGIDWWRESKWGRDLMNGEYREIFTDRDLGVLDGWWAKAVDRLGRWRAYRGRTKPNSKAEILSRGEARLAQISTAYGHLIGKGPAEPCIADFTWEEIEQLYLQAFEVKPSVVFASKMCHFLLPNLFIVMDNWATDASDYEMYWRGMRDAWLSASSKEVMRRLVLETIRAESNPHVRYPVETKIMELCHIGRKHAAQTYEETEAWSEAGIGVTSV